MANPGVTLETIFADLKDEWHRQGGRARIGYDRHLSQIEEQLPMLRAVIAHNRGDKVAVQRLLRSDHPLTAEDRETLAQFLDGDFDPPIAQGRPKSNQRFIAMIAERFIDEWRELAQQYDCSTHGKSDWMREQAVEFLINDYPPQPFRIDPEAVLEIMRRPKGRRN